jgi:hypothetical protein
MQQEAKMSALKSLNFVAVPKSTTNDPKFSRRAKLVTQLEQQLGLAKDENFYVRRQKWVTQEDGTKQLVDRPKRVKRWWRVDGSGNCYLILRYGNKILSPTPDKGAIGVGDKTKLVGVLEAVIEAAKSGELDVAIETAQGPKRVIKRKAA